MACANGSHSSCPRILLIDPHSDTAELYDWALEAAGFRVCRAPLDACHPVTCNPDAAIACMRQPDGAFIRKMLRGRRIPTILLTGWLSPGTTAHVMECDALLVIPVEPATLVDKVRELLLAA